MKGKRVMSYDSALKELMDRGIIPSTVEEYKDTHDIDRHTLEILNTLEKVNGNEFSEEQREILTHKGNMCIIACAGSGKALVNGTGVLTNLGYKPIESLRVYTHFILYVFYSSSPLRIFIVSITLNIVYFPRKVI